METAMENKESDFLKGSPLWQQVDITSLSKYQCTLHVVVYWMLFFTEFLMQYWSADSRSVPNFQPYQKQYTDLFPSELFDWQI